MRLGGKWLAVRDPRSRLPVRLRVSRLMSALRLGMGPLKSLWRRSRLVRLGGK